MDLYLNLLHLLYQYQDLVLNLQKLRLLLLHLHHLDLYQDYLQAMNLDFLLADQMIRHYQHLIQLDGPALKPPPDPPAAPACVGAQSPDPPPPPPDAE